MKTRFVLTGALLTLLVSAAPARAQRTGFAVNRFEPAERGSQFLVNDTLDLRGHGRTTLGLTLDYAYKPLVLYENDGTTERAAVVRHQLFSHFGTSVVLWDRLRLGATLPIALYQDGEPARVDTAAGPEILRPPGQAALGDVRLAADVRIAGQHGGPIQFAAGVRGWVPTGSRSEFTSDGSFRIAPQVMIAGDLAPFTYAARGAVIVRPRDDDYGGSHLGSEFYGSAGVGLKTLEGKLVIGPEVFASTVFTNSDAFFKTRGSPAEWLFGGHYDIGALRVGGSVGGGLNHGYGAPQIRALLSVEYLVPAGTADRDKDGVPDSADACPDSAGEQTADAARNGCPSEGPDADGDAIPDRTDNCPRERGVRTDDPTTNGCPDRDNDGVIDSADACPDATGMRNADPAKNGCPPDSGGTTDGPDADADGVPDTARNSRSTRTTPAETVSFRAARDVDPLHVHFRLRSVVGVPRDVRDRGRRLRFALAEDVVLGGRALPHDDVELAAVRHDARRHGQRSGRFGHVILLDEVVAGASSPAVERVAREGAGHAVQARSSFEAPSLEDERRLRAPGLGRPRCADRRR